MVIVDTNYILRFLVKDNTEQYEIARSVLLGSEVYLLPEVLLKSVFVLEKIYKITRESIVLNLSEIVFSNNIGLSDKDVYGKAFHYYTHTSLGYPDCVAIAFSISHKLQLVTFDKQMTSIYNKELS